MSTCIFCSSRSVVPVSITLGKTFSGSLSEALRIGGNRQRWWQGILPEIDDNLFCGNLRELVNVITWLKCFPDRWTSFEWISLLLQDPVYLIAIPRPKALRYRKIIGHPEGRESNEPFIHWTLESKLRPVTVCEMRNEFVIDLVSPISKWFKKFDL